MALSEKLVKDQLTPSPHRYASRVRWLAIVYLVLNPVSLALIVIILWRVQFFITIAQRSNVETLVLAIIFVLAAYYLATTFRGFLGALRIVWLNLPGLWARSDGATLEVERRKQASLKASEESSSVYFDQAVRLKGKPDQPIRWLVGDKAGKLGDLEVDGVRATYYPKATGINGSLFEFLADQIEQNLSKSELDPTIQIVQWGTVNDDESAAYYSTVRAFQNLDRTLRADRESGSPLWPTVTIEQDTVDRIQGELEKLAPVLRNESFLPNVEYEVEWTVPILPEPLSFVQLKRHENRADPVVSMGCATLIVLVILAVILLFIIFPPWLPSK